MRWPFQRTLNRQNRQPAEASAGPLAVQLSQRMEGINRWREQFNPLRSLTLQQAVAYLEASQRGDFGDLEWAYYFIEQADATLFALLDRRTSAMLALDWNLKVVDQERQGPDFDKKLAEDQREFLRAAYDRIDNLKAAIEHLEIAAFRSFAHLQKHRDENGEITHLEVLDQWNWARDGLYGSWYWNPKASRASAQTLGEENRIGGDELPESEFIIRECPRHINRIALAKFIRKSLGEKDWSAFIEIFGMDAVFVIMPPNIPESKKNEYYATASNASQGGGGALPDGSDVKFANAQRGVVPFRDFIRFCDEEMVKAGTGGLLTMLTAPGSGTLAGSAHQETFRLIAEMEAAKISELFQRSMDKPLLAEAFPDKPILVYWELASQEKRNPSEILDDCAKAATARLLMDPEEISEMTGYKLDLMPEGMYSGSPGAQQAYPYPTAPDRARATNREQPGGPDDDSLGVLLGDARLQLAEAEQQILEPLGRIMAEPYLRALRNEITPDELRAELLRIRDEELPRLCVEMNVDPDTARVLEELMGAAMANGIAEAAEART